MSNLRADLRGFDHSQIEVNSSLLVSGGQARHVRALLLILHIVLSDLPATSHLSTYGGGGEGGQSRRCNPLQPNRDGELT